MSMCISSKVYKGPEDTNMILPDSPLQSLLVLRSATTNQAIIAHCVASCQFGRSLRPEVWLDSSLMANAHHIDWYSSYNKETFFFGSYYFCNSEDFFVCKYIYILYMTFIEIQLCARHCSKALYVFTHLIFMITPWGAYFNGPHFKGMNTVALRD